MKLILEVIVALQKMRLGQLAKSPLLYIQCPHLTWKRQQLFTLALHLQRGIIMASLLQRVSSQQAKLVSKSHLLPALASSLPTTTTQQRNLSVHEHVSMSLLQVEFSKSKEFDC